METYTSKLSYQEIQELKARYPKAEQAKTPPYAYYQIRLSDCVITAYQSGKVVFQGEGAAHHAGVFQPQQSTAAHYPQAGSDEVGTGDYFGPICVCAAYVTKEDETWLRELHIQDSKQVRDEQIRQLAPQLLSRLPHSLLILSDEKYNEVHEHFNMNAIKAQLHNQAYLHLIKKLHHQPQHIYLDQFTPEHLYYRYLHHEPQIVKGIHFETKAENKYLAVACGSIIARYAFLQKMDELSAQYQFEFPKGAGKGVDEQAKIFVSLHGAAALSMVAKLHFANTQRILTQ